MVLSVRGGMRWRLRARWTREIILAQMVALSRRSGNRHLSWLRFMFSDKPIGASSLYATVAGFLGKAIAPRHTESLEYFKSNPPKLNWEFVFVVSAIWERPLLRLLVAGL